MRRHHERPHRVDRSGRKAPLTESLPTAGEWVEILYRRPHAGVQPYGQLVLDSARDLIVTFQPAAEIQKPVLADGRPILYPGSPVIWFTIPGAWHDIGMFFLPDGSYTGLYANILTPVEFVTPVSWSTTDLYLDVWIPWGGAAQLLDEAEFKGAAARELIDANTASKARAEAEKLLKDYEAGSWPPRRIKDWTLGRAQSARQAWEGK